VVGVRKGRDIFLGRQQTEKVCELAAGECKKTDERLVLVKI